MFELPVGRITAATNVERISMWHQPNLFGALIFAGRFVFVDVDDDYSMR